MTDTIFQNRMNRFDALLETRTEIVDTIEVILAEVNVLQDRCQQYCDQNQKDLLTKTLARIEKLLDDGYELDKKVYAIDKECEAIREELQK